MKLQELLAGIPVLDAAADLETEITGVSYDSRRTKPGDLFVAMTGFATDGHQYIGKALENGAAAVLCQQTPETDCPYIQTEDSRRALAVVGANWFHHPASGMTMIAVTGTNGKTTTTYLLKAILEQTLGAKVGLIGTNQNMIGQEVIPTERTTPESFEVQHLFRQMADAGCTHVVMETSSHALALDRVYGVRYQVGIFTNLTQDHLDFHKTMEEYRKAKAKLFTMCEKGVFNADDPTTPQMIADAACEVYTVGTRDASLLAENIELGSDHVAMTVREGDTAADVRVGIPGRFTVSNALVALGIVRQLGVSLADAAKALGRAQGVKGRVEVVPTPGKPFTVLIDYAHTPDGLENVLRSVKDYCKGRVILVFGCGGDRDRTKRPIMGEIAVKYADFVIVTSDNPRTENPMSIICDILSGITGTKTPYAVEEDRRRAIKVALRCARKHDMIILAGKGHETYQILGTKKVHLDEREEVAAALCELEK